jgi:hypothetical protein
MDNATPVTPTPVISADAGNLKRGARRSALRVWIPDQVRDDEMGTRWIDRLRVAIGVLLAAALPAPLAAAPATPRSTPKSCTLIVDGKRLVSGRCLVFPLGDGGYTLNTWDHGKPRQSHFAQVNARPDGTGDATWNKDPTDDHALDPLGKVRLVHGCWVNHRTRICAR